MRKAIISFVMSVRASAQKEQFGSHWTDFHNFEYFSKTPQQIQVSLKSEKNNGYLTCKAIYIKNTSRPVLIRMRTFSDKHCRENQNTHLCSITFFSNIVPFKRQRGKSFYSRTGQRRQYGSCASHAEYVRLYIYIYIYIHTHTHTHTHTLAHTHTHTHTEYAILAVMPLQQWLHQSAWNLHYTYINP